MASAIIMRRRCQTFFAASVWRYFASDMDRQAIQWQQ